MLAHGFEDRVLGCRGVVYGGCFGGFRGFGVLGAWGLGFRYFGWFRI